MRTGRVVPKTPAAFDDFRIDLQVSIEQHRSMSSESDSSSGLQKLFRWATTPPQAYVVYVLALIAVYGVTFLAGTLAPKKHLTPPADQVSAPVTK